MELHKGASLVMLAAFRKGDKKVSTKLFLQNIGKSS